ncbi:MAG: formimidoylglutamate deiminase [Acidobacteriaceae bacterium]
MKTLYRPEMMYVDGSFARGKELLVGADGLILESTPDMDVSDLAVVDLRGKALMPGFVNAHSHSFQRLIRGKSESRVVSGRDFWSWRGTMYHAASQLDPKQVYDVARMTFLEMVLAGTTTVGEFHYLHNAPDGSAYDDPNLLAKQVIAAAKSVGIRIVLLRTAYVRSGFELPRDSGQTRFFESAGAFLKNMTALVHEASASGPTVQFGVAPHSVRAVPLRELHEIAEWTRAKKLPLHMHVAEQVAENEACFREYGATPVALLARERLLRPDFTAVHGVHVTAEEIAMLAKAQVTVCSCPTTERNLGDGFVKADEMLAAGIHMALGSDSQAQIDPLEDARELEYHLRLLQQKRAILDQIGEKTLAAHLFDSATIGGARSLAVRAGDLKPGNFADFVTVDLRDSSIAGNTAEDLLPTLVFSMNRSAVCDVVVHGTFAVRDGRHAWRDEIVSRYSELHEQVWSGQESL